MPERDHTHIPAFLAGLSVDELDELLGGLDQQRFATGSVVLAEGERVDAMYLIQSGSAEVFVSDRRGAERRVGFVRPGETLGEMSILTGATAVATVRATTELEVLLLRRNEFERLAMRFPQLYRNLGTLLAERLARTDRLAAREHRGGLFVLRDAGAPPLLGYAIACSLAYHAHGPTLLVALDDDVAPELERLAHDPPSADGEPRAQILLGRGRRDLTPHNLRATVHDLFHGYDHVLIQSRGPREELATARTVWLTGTPGRPAGAEGLVVAAWHRPPRRVGADARGVVAVPELRAEDQRALVSGTLPGRSPAGRAIGWVARDLGDLKVGVALGAGSIRGFAHVGVLQVLEELMLPIDYIAGTSVGSIVAATYAVGVRPALIARYLAEGPAFRPTVPVKSVLSIRGLAKMIERIGEGREFGDTDIPLAVVAADLDTQREVVFRRGDLASAVVASISIPGVYPAQLVGDYTLVDGGVLNPVPVTALADMGAGRVVAVKLGTPPVEYDDDAFADANEVRRPRPSLLSVMLRSIEIMQNRIAVQADVPMTAIVPRFGELPTKLRNFSAGQRFVEAGEEAAREALPRLATTFPWLKASR